MKEKVSKSQYKLAKVLVIICLAFLAISVVLLIMELAFILRTGAKWSSILSPALNVLTFSILCLNNHFTVKRYKKEQLEEAAALQAAATAAATEAGALPEAPQD